MANGKSFNSEYRGWGLREVTYLLSVLAAIVAFVAWVININGRMFASEAQKEETLWKVKVAYEHSRNKDVHQPYQQKIKEWYQRKEGEENRIEIKKLDERLNRLERMEKTLNDIKALILQQMKERK